MAVVIGVDLGTSGARAIAIDADGSTRAWRHDRLPEAGSWPPGRADPHAWRASLERALHHVLAGGDEIAAVAIGGQSPTTVPMSGELAVTCRHPVGSGRSLCEQQVAQHELIELEMGHEIVPAQIWDWALRQLGAGDIQGLWPGDEVIPGFGEPVPVAEVVGHSNGNLGLPSGTPLVSAYNDAFMSFWAAGLGLPGRGHDPGGQTGGLAIAIAGQDRPDELFGFPGIVAGIDVVGGPVNGHGQLLDWWAAMSHRSIPDVLREADAVPPGARGVFVLPYHDGERAPRWEPRLRGEIHGLSFETTSAEIGRAVLEAAAYGLRHVYQDLERSGVSMEVLSCGGSPARSRLWNTIKASVLDIPVDEPAHPERLSAYGCALAAGAAAGWWAGVQAPDMSTWPALDMVRIEPQPCTAYREGYERFVAAGDAAVARLSMSSCEEGALGDPSLPTTTTEGREA